MEPVAPKAELFLLPEGVKEVVYAKDQPEYLPLPTLKTPDGRVVTSWQPTPGELELLKLGVAVTIVLHTFNRPLTPIMVAVGGLDLRGEL